MSGQFHTFGVSHWVALAAVVAVATGAALVGRRSRSPRVVRGLAWAIAAILVINELVYLGISYATKPWMEFLQKALPLHICGAGVFLTAWVLIRRSQRGFEVAYFWGMAGTVQALITPNLIFDFPTSWYFNYFIGHGGIVAGVLYAAVAMGLRPQRWAVVRAFLVTNALMIVVGLIDWILYANYMFLWWPPHGQSPFFFLPWPWYIAFLQAFGVSLGLVVYSPFWLARRRRMRRLAQRRLPDAAN